MPPKPLWLLPSLFPLPLLAQTQKGIDAQINDLISPATDFISEIVFFSFPVGESVSMPFVLLWLIVGALFFTFYLRFVNFTAFRHAIEVVRGDYDNPLDKGEVSHFQALATALSGTVGLGNIAGVAIAISLGGPGATLWMILAGLLGMTSKFVECTLGVKYRQVHPDGSVSGGPMYYLSEGLVRRGFKAAGKLLAGFFALMCIGGSLGAGNMFQGNQATQQLVSLAGPNSFFASNSWFIGLLMALIVGLVIIGGIRSIARVTEKIVPFMCGLYLLAALVILLMNLGQLPEVLRLIVEGAFAPEAAYGGVLGVLIQGFRRAAFSNEAGIGSASIAHAAVKTDEPVSEGVVALLEPFIDTVVVCTMTALVIIITGHYTAAADDGIALTSASFATVIWWFPYVLSVAVVLFAFSTMLSWSYYGLKSWTYLFGQSAATEMSFKVLFCAVIVLGAAMELGSVVAFSDAMIFAMSFPNIIGLYIMAPEVKRDLAAYRQKLKNGKIKKYA